MNNGKMMVMEKVDYHGTPLFQPEAQFLAELEHLVRKTVPRVPSIFLVLADVTSDTNITRVLGFASEGGHVVELCVFNFRLKCLPESIGQLRSLRQLDLTSCRLKALPESIGQLHALEKLSLSLNKLVSLPEIFGELHALKSLFLSQNQLKVLPESIGQLRSLEDLHLDKNKLSSLPDSVRNLGNLRSLDIKKNPMEPLKPETLRWLEARRIPGWW